MKFHHANSPALVERMASSNNEHHFLVVQRLKVQFAQTGGTIGDAEIKLGSADPQGSWYDVDLLLREWLAYLEPDPRRRPGLVGLFLARAQSELEAPGVWAAVEAVASALLNDVRLDGPRARDLATA